MHEFSHTKSYTWSISSAISSDIVVIGSLQFSTLLLHHWSHHIYSGNHTNYFPIYNRNMPDAILCKEGVIFEGIFINTRRMMEKQQTQLKYQHWINFF